MSTITFPLAARQKALTKKKFETVQFYLPAILGTIVEYYDYALYGFCAVFLAQAFFPSSSPTVALLKTFGIFVAGFMSKPIGAILFGYIGDKFGRRLALKISMIGIAIPTLVIGLLPTYDTIGWLAPFLLLICRIFQGIFLSGEYDGVRIFMFESVGKKYPNLANSLTNLAGMLGYYSASLIGMWITQPDLPIWIWRVPFLLSGVFGFLVFWYRCSVQESLAFRDFLNHASNAPFKSFREVFFQNKRLVLATLLLFGAVGGGYHFYFTFLGNYLSQILHIITNEEASFLASYSVLLYTVFGPIAGLAADRFGAARVFKYAALSLCMLTLLNIILLYQNANGLSMGIILLTASVLPFFHAPGFIILIEKIQVNERYRCISFGHSMGSMLFSGSAPLVSLWIWKITEMPAVPFFYFLFLIFMGFLALYVPLSRNTIPRG